MFVDVVTVLVVAMAIVDVVDVVTVLNGLVTIALVVFALVVLVNRLFGVPLTVMEMIHVAIMFSGGMTVARQVLVVRCWVTRIRRGLARWTVSHFVPHFAKATMTL